ncbi:MAG: FKBP-type peptidyl-prolyl cis-trans isomerase [Planctomycetota bacterium]
MKRSWHLVWVATAVGAGLLAGRVGFDAQPAVAQESLPAQTPPAAQTIASAPFEQQLSYCLGLNIGVDMRQNGVPLDLKSFTTGVADALAGAKPRLTDGQRQAILQRFQQQLQQKAQALMAESKQRGEAFLAENAKKEGVVTTASGLQYKVIEAGTGETPTARDTVRCHYEGTLIDGKVFDSSYRRGQPAEFPVGGVIAGWTEALQLMKVGAKWEVYLPSEIAYGAGGAGADIGPHETLIFTIELLGIVK